MQILNERQLQKGNNSNHLIFTFNGKALTPGYVCRKFKSYVIQAQLNTKLNFHSLRSTFASWLIQRGASMKSESQMLGHSCVKITESHYAFLRPDDLIESINKLNN